MNVAAVNLLLRPVQASDLPQVVQLDQHCFGGLWTIQGYGREVDSPNSDLLALWAVPTDEVNSIQSAIAPFPSSPALHTSNTAAAAADSFDPGSSSDALSDALSDVLKDDLDDLLNDSLDKKLAASAQSPPTASAGFIESRAEKPQNSLDHFSENSPDIALDSALDSALDNLDNSAKNKADLIGIGCLWAILEEAHITLLGIDPRYRRQGLGQLLLYALLASAHQRGLERATLEVRQSNQRAIALYQRFGFRTAGSRKQYYPDGEDALILWRSGLHHAEFAQKLQAWQQEIHAKLQAHGWQDLAQLGTMQR